MPPRPVGRLNDLTSIYEVKKKNNSQTINLNITSVCGYQPVSVSLNLLKRFGPSFDNLHPHQPGETSHMILYLFETTKLCFVMLSISNTNAKSSNHVQVYVSSLIHEIYKKYGSAIWICHDLHETFRPALSKKTTSGCIKSAFCLARLAGSFNATGPGGRIQGRTTGDIGHQLISCSLF